MATPETRWLTDDIGMIDLHFLGVPRIIAAYVLATDDGLALIETGPATTLDALAAGIRALGRDAAGIRHILVTHIHLDHAGAVGTLMRQLPDARFYVHEIGAPHMLDPTSLIRSATRIYGDDMERLWGEFLPVPADRTTILRDNDQLEIGGHVLDVIYTPGHASHHITFHEPASQVAFAGDVAGIRIPPQPLPLPPTPPPDINVEAWKASIARLQALDLHQVLLAHFGPTDNVADALTALSINLDAFVEIAERAVEQGLSRDELIIRLTEYARGLMTADDYAAVEAQLALASPFGMAADGLLRYLRKRDEARA